MIYCTIQLCALGALSYLISHCIFMPLKYHGMESHMGLLLLFKD